LLEARNEGDATTDGSAIVLSAHLAPRFVAVSSESFQLSCAAVGGGPLGGATNIECTGNNLTAVHRSLSLAPTVAVTPGDSETVTSHFEVSGGGLAGSAATVDPTLILAERPPFGIDAFDSQLEDGAAGFNQASTHPHGLTTSILLNTAEDPVYNNPFEF